MWGTYRYILMYSNVELSCTSQALNLACPGCPRHEWSPAVPFASYPTGCCPGRPEILLRGWRCEHRTVGKVYQKYLKPISLPYQQIGYASTPQRFEDGSYVQLVVRRQQMVISELAHMYLYISLYMYILHMYLIYTYLYIYIIYYYIYSICIVCQRLIVLRWRIYPSCLWVGSFFGTFGCNLPVRISQPVQWFWPGNARRRNLPFSGEPEEESNLGSKSPLKITGNGVNFCRQNLMDFKGFWDTIFFWYQLDAHGM